MLSLGQRSCAVFGLALALSIVSGCTGPKKGVERGEALWGGCTQCHGEEGHGRELIMAPAIAGLPSWYVESQLNKFKIGHRGFHPGDLPALKMRPMALTLETESEVKAITAFVATLPPADPPRAMTIGDAKRGKTAFATCMACHGPDAAGMKALNSPNLTGQADWYMLAQLKKFKAGIRGKAKGDTTGAQMGAIAGTLTESAMEDVVAYIMTLPLQKSKEQ